MEKEEVFGHIDSMKVYMLSHIPMGRNSARKIVSGRMDQAKLHVEAVYRKGMKFSDKWDRVPEEYEKNRDYLFHYHGLKRHIQDSITVMRAFDPAFSLDDFNE